MGNRDNLVAFLLILGFAAAQAGCAGALTTQPVIIPLGGEAAPNTSDTLVAPPTSSPDIETPLTTPGRWERIEPPGPGKGLGEVSAKILDEIIADLVQRTGAERQDIELIRADAVVWPADSLGCPQPGMFYAQVLTPGYLIRLEASEQVYVYHTDMDNAVILCGSKKSIDENVKDGWPSQTRDKDVIIVTPTINR